MRGKGGWNIGESILFKEDYGVIDGIFIRKVKAHSMSHVGAESKEQLAKVFRAHAKTYMYALICSA